MLYHNNKYCRVIIERGKWIFTLSIVNVWITTQTSLPGGFIYHSERMLFENPLTIVAWRENYNDK